jgi:SAM-dependent methyltransferase
LKSGSTVKVKGVDEQQAPPNHHADYPGFAGVGGLVAALSMVLGRKGDALLAVRLSGMGPGDPVVDVGCGPGVAVRYAARRGAVVTGVDPAPVMLRVARLLTRRPARTRYVSGAAEAIPLPGDSASVVWSIATVHHWSDIDAGLREARRVLLPGGRLVAMERWARPGARGHASYGWTDQQANDFVDRCREHGFADVRLERTTIGRRSTVSVIASAP